MSDQQDFNDALLRLAKLGPLTAREREAARLMVSDTCRTMMAELRGDFDAAAVQVYEQLFLEQSQPITPEELLAQAQTFVNDYWGGPDFHPRMETLADHNVPLYQLIRSLVRNR